ncbi:MULTISPECIES: histidinol dehydrogenase [unclassified Aeromicrobium]|uniref:histidinol dehydrogenase n=1 Tax=unclassified Aeromicrobium TaxID=2633570 RepID=UPI00070183A7|nr:MULTISPECIES: histidinol dehydrogenase [unclassified Aeromicrobium]KQP75988.1 histidinol dehydrogenase [Aeromicrobium sp. Leaf289]KQP85016.1 histidinol dehydrogenase [Aeromicrobium sp. Leaf291]
MIRRLDLRLDPTAELPRAQQDVEHALEVVAPLCEDVRARGEEAVLEYGERFDGVRPASLRVAPEHLAAALEELDPAIRAGLEESVARLRVTCEAELEQTVVTTVAEGATVERRIVPMQRVGLYVPGGLAPLVSTVVMNTVPAQVAGVGSIALTSPPQSEFGGLPHPTILAACALLGIDEVYAAGGAQALALLAYGSVATGGSVRPVDLVTGPGNIYVAAAKRYLQGTVAIDSEAGPTEIAVIADDTADPAFVAADMISQSEHDPMAASVLVTPSDALADAVTAELERQVPTATHAERITTSLAGRQSAIVLVDDLDQAVDVANAYAAEHLEIQTADSAAVAARIVNAGAIFVGAWTPVSLGDYAAGSNHVLPTAGCACHSSGLSVRAFCKNVHVVTYTEQALREVGHHVEVLAAAEDLPSHGAAVGIRTGSSAAQGPAPLPGRAE